MLVIVILIYTLILKDCCYFKLIFSHHRRKKCFKTENLNYELPNRIIFKWIKLSPVTSLSKLLAGFLYFFLFCSQAKAEHEAHVSQLNEEEAEIEKVITKFRNNLHYWVKDILLRDFRTAIVLKRTCCHANLRICNQRKNVFPESIICYLSSI